MGKDAKIGFGSVLLFLLASLAARTRGLEVLPFAVLFGITFLCLAARYSFVALDKGMVFAAVSWSLGLLGFYGGLWLHATVHQVWGQVLVTGVLAYIFVDYRQRNQHLRENNMRIGGLAAVVLYFFLSSVDALKLPLGIVTRLLPPLAVLIALLVGMSYWSFLAGRDVRWPWRRN